MHFSLFPWTRSNTQVIEHKSSSPIYLPRSWRRKGNVAYIRGSPENMLTQSRGNERGWREKRREDLASAFNKSTAAMLQAWRRLILTWFSCGLSSRSLLSSENVLFILQIRLCALGLGAAQDKCSVRLNEWKLDEKSFSMNKKGTSKLDSNLILSKMTASHVSRNWGQ